MSFFGRAANLVKGGIKSLTRPTEPDARERALDEELARSAPRVSQPASPAPRTPAAPQPTEGERRPPERDEHGNVKRTL